MNVNDRIRSKVIAAIGRRSSLVDKRHIIGEESIIKFMNDIEEIVLQELKIRANSSIREG
jgi:hypothetical protein